jgi:aminopeptidase N
MYDHHLYEGCAGRLNTLRHELGEEIFWNAVRDYVRSYREQVVETTDLMRIMEEHSGRSLGKFFDQWFYSPGYPSLEIKFDYDPKHQKGCFEIRQTQENRESGVPLFTLSAGLLWMIDGEERRAQVTLDKSFHSFIFPMPKRPDQVRFDPEGAVLHKLTFNPGEDLLRVQLRCAPDVVGRIQAGLELIKTGRRANLQAVLDAYPSEPFWGVRCQWIKALGESNSEIALTGLLKIIACEQEPRTLLEAFQAAAKYQDTRIRNAILDRLQAQTLPYLARGAAYEALGAQREIAPSAYLREAAQHDEDNGFSQMSAMLGLAQTGKDESIDFLKTKTAPGATPNRARYGAVLALARASKKLKETARQEIVEILVSLLRDPYWRVRQCAEQGLEILRSVESIPVLEAYSRPLSLQDRVRVEQIIHRLRTMDQSQGMLQKQVDELREHLRMLVDQIQKLEARLDSSDRKVE